MAKQSGGDVLRHVNIGFSTIMFLSWGSELAGVPHLLYGDPVDFNWPRVLVRSLAILGVWTWAYYTIRRLVRRLHRLEEFLLVCGWCRKVGHEGEWLTMEQYFGTHLDTQTSHGICPECSRKAHAKLEQQIAEAGGRS